MTVRILTGDARDRLKELPDGSVHCCVTSPPYFGLRDYGVSGQIGLEATPDAFVAELVSIFREVRRVLRDDGTLWLNLGDSYAGSWGAQGRQGETGQMASRSVSKVREKSKISAAQIAAHPQKASHTGSIRQEGLKPKDIIGIPWLVAFALRADGWYLRQDIIWSKPNPMPESVTDRCTKAHEYLFLLAKSPRYYFAAAEIAEAVAPSTVERLLQPTLAAQAGSDRVPGKTNGRMKAVVNSRLLAEGAIARTGGLISGGTDKSSLGVSAETTRNRRSVWTVTTQPFSEAHFATFPPALIEPCILAGCPKGGTVLDPFFGAGTTGLVADRNGRDCIGIELNPEYAAMAERRISDENPMFSRVVIDAPQAEAAE